MALATCPAELRSKIKAEDDTQDDDCDCDPLTDDGCDCDEEARSDGDNNGDDDCPGVDDEDYDETDPCHDEERSDRLRIQSLFNAKLRHTNLK